MERRGPFSAPPYGLILITDDGGPIDGLILSGGVAFVMNEGGATVGKFDLSVCPPKDGDARSTANAAGAHQES